ncbi:MAG: hypothetical protein IJP37_04310 [Clostridia bacterium]|nr:hypothetical protein [Clostridia bacterium]MBR0026365.1 hypothetical protein [Clostridia bacterium]
MFKKSEPKEPVLLGEDFDIFPDITAEDTESCEKFSNVKANPAKQQEAPAKQEEPVQEQPKDRFAVPEEKMTKLQKKCAAKNEAEWKKIQIITGCILGVIGAIFIFVVPIFAPIGLFSFLAAIVVVLLFPRHIERRCARSMPKLRNWVAISLAIAMVLAAGITYLVNPGAITGGAQ